MSAQKLGSLPQGALWDHPTSTRASGVAGGKLWGLEARLSLSGFIVGPLPLKSLQQGDL